MDLLNTITNLTVLVFIVTSMAVAGLGLTLSTATAPLRRVWLVAGAITANFVIVPALAVGLTKLVSLPAPYETGLLLLGCAAGAPFLPKLAESAHGDFAWSVALMLLLIVGSAGFMPLVLPQLIPGLSAEAWPILKPLLFTMLLPLAAGMAVRASSKQRAEWLQRPLKQVSTISMLAAVALLIGVNLRSLAGTFGSGAAATGVVFVAASTLTGWIFGGTSRDTRIVSALGAGQRNIAAALVIATQNFSDPGVARMLLVTTLAGLLVLLPAARKFGPKPDNVQQRPPEIDATPSPSEAHHGQA